MGLSSSKSTQNQTSTTGPSAVALPQINAATDALKGAYGQTQPVANNVGATLDQMFRSYQANDGSTLAGAKAANDAMLTGGGVNPQLDNIINTTNNSVADRVNALFSKSGQTGSSRQIGELGTRLGENEANLRYQDYNTQQGHIAQAIQNALGFNTAENQNTAADIANVTALGSGAVAIPGQPAAQLAAGLGSLWGNATTSTGSGTSTQSGNIFQGLLGLGGAALSGWASGGFK